MATRVALLSFSTAALLTLAGACADSSSSTDEPTGADADKDGGAGKPKSDGSDGTDPDDPTKEGGAGGDAGDAALTTCTPTTSGFGRGLTWVRTNPMMISALSVVMGSPSKAAVGEYFDTFHATAAHVWANGLPTEIAGWGAASQPGFRYVAWVQKDGTSVANNQVLGGASVLPGRIGYQIGDEPLSTADLNGMIAGAAVVKGADPDGLRIVNLNDSDAANDLRTQAIQAADFDVLSYDHYTLGTGASSGLNATRSAALAAGKPYWRYVKSFHYKSDSPSLTPSDLRWDALIGAVFGFTGYTWFVYSVEAGSQDLAPELFNVGGDYAATKTALYPVAATLNQELAQIGRTLTLLKSTDVRYVASISLLKPAGIDAWAKGAGNDPYLSKVTLGGSHDLLVGHFTDDCGEQYVMVQNQAHAGGSFPNTGTAADNFTLEFDFAGTTDPALDKSALLALDATTGSVTSRALAPTGASTAKLDLQLDAGAILFFKYKTGRTFVHP